jgi:hypothetical protein
MRLQVDKLVNKLWSGTHLEKRNVEHQTSHEKKELEPIWSKMYMMKSGWVEIGGNKCVRSLGRGKLCTYRNIAITTTTIIIKIIASFLSKFLYVFSFPVLFSYHNSEIRNEIKVSVFHDGCQVMMS